MSEPNLICKYSECKIPYFSCANAIERQSWRGVACCPEHYQAYVKEVLIARGEWIEEVVEPVTNNEVITETKKSTKSKDIEKVSEEIN